MASLTAGQSRHVGGALGLGGLLAALAGCTFLQMQAPSGSGSGSFMPWSLTQVHTLPEAEPPLAEPAGEIAMSGSERERDLTSERVARPEAAPRPRAVERAAQPAQATTQTRQAAFIVKLRGEPMIDEVISNCRSDRAAADALWQDWSTGDEVFAGMTLESCSYSGELILGAEIIAGPQGAEAGVDALLSRIRNHGSVAYADPDFTAFPGTSGE